MTANRMTAADFMMMEIQEEQERNFKALQNARVVDFLKGNYEFEEGEVLLGLEHIQDACSSVQIGTKHKWTELETIITVLGYLNNVDTGVLSNRLPDIPLKSIGMKYKNCLFLDKGKTKGSLEHCSALHREVWDRLKNTI